MDRTKVEAISNLLTQIINENRTKFEALGANVTIGHGRFDVMEYRKKITFHDMIPADNQTSDEQLLRISNAMFINKIPANPSSSNIGKTFHEGRHDYTITEVKFNCPKFPYVAKRDDGKNFRFKTEVIHNHLNIK